MGIDVQGQVKHHLRRSVDLGTVFDPNGHVASLPCGATERQIWRGERHSAGGRYVMYGQPVLRLVRFALLAVLVFLVLGLVVALGSPQTGPIEKAVLALAIVGLLAAGVPVRRIGSQA